MSAAARNSTVARLDRSAARAGLPLKERSINGREFRAFGREFSYRPGGLGLVRVCAFVDGKLDTIAHRTVSQMEALFERAVAYNEEEQS